MIAKTDAVVLKSMKFRGSSKIVTFYTRRYGKLKGIAKGARELKSQFGAALEPMTCVGLVLYKKETRDLHLISQCDILRSYKRIHSDIERMTVTLSVLELVHQLAHEEEENPLLYSLLLETMDALELSEGPPLNILFAFELRLCHLFGFGPSWDRCMRCGKASEDLTGGDVVLQLMKGAMFCPACGAEQPAVEYERLLRQRHRSVSPANIAERLGNLRIPLRTHQILRRLSTAPLESVGTIRYHGNTGNELDATLRLYLRYHFEDLKPLKSLDILKQITTSYI
jgi:DNA repair protein RecO (recombination protein O)